MHAFQDAVALLDLTGPWTMYMQENNHQVWLSPVPSRIPTSVQQAVLNMLPVQFSCLETTRNLLFFKVHTLSALLDAVVTVFNPVASAFFSTPQHTSHHPAPGITQVT